MEKKYKVVRTIKKRWDEVCVGCGGFFFYHNSQPYFIRGDAKDWRLEVDGDTQTSTFYKLEEVKE